MPEESMMGAAQKILDVGVIGAALILVLGALAWVTKQWLSEMKAKDEVQEARLADTKEHARIAEDLRNVMQGNTVAIKAVLDLYRGKERP